METFFNWLSKPIPKDEIITWFNIHNMYYEKIELYGDVFKSLNQVIVDTYLGSNINETKIILSEEDNMSHFNWCWKKTIEGFRKENILINESGEHKEYFESFFLDSFYNQQDFNIKESISLFLEQIFRIDNTFSKSDLDLMTELYKLMEKNIE